MFDLLIPDGMETRVPPAEFRVFSVGVNETEKGDFLFDAKAAASVMAAWSERKIDLSIDYEHQSLSDPPMESPNAATKWVPEIRNGELWATQVRWTDRAAGYLTSGEYRYFSPAFEFDEKTTRVTKLINIALTNNPAMRGITPLVAATAKKEGTKVDYEELFNDLKAEHEKLKADIASRDAKLTELTAQLARRSAADDAEDDDDEDEKKAKASMNASLSLRPSARSSERALAVHQIANLRAGVRSLTGAENDATALGLLTAWKESHAKVAQLSAQVETIEAERLTKDFETLLDDASKGGALEPAKRAAIKEQALKMGNGKLTPDAVNMARAFLSARPAQVNTTAAKIPQSDGSAASLHPTQLHIAKVCGRDPAETAKHLHRAS